MGLKMAKGKMMEFIKEALEQGNFGTNQAIPLCY